MAWLVWLVAFHAQLSHAADYRQKVAQSWVRSGFATCVRIRESGDGRGSRNLYGMLDTTWQSVGGRGRPQDAPRREQDYRAYILFQRSGTAPWRPYDGC